MIRRFLVLLVLTVQLFTTSLFSSGVDYSLIYEHGIESVDEIEKLCSALEKRLDELEETRRSFSLGLTERQRLIGLLTQNYPDMSGDLALRIESLVARLESLELKDRAVKRKKFLLKALGIGLGVTALAALLYYGIGKIKEVRADRNARRDAIQNRMGRLQGDIELLNQNNQGLARDNEDVRRGLGEAIAENGQLVQQNTHLNALVRRYGRLLGFVRNGNNDLFERFGLGADGQ